MKKWSNANLTVLDISETYAPGPDAIHHGPGANQPGGPGANQPGPGPNPPAGAPVPPHPVGPIAEATGEAIAEILNGNS